MAEFGISKFKVAATNQDGTPDLQAGSHPYALTTAFELNVSSEPGKVFEGEVKDLSVGLPPGLVGDPTATPRCTDAEFNATLRDEGVTCPIDTAVGLDTTYVAGPNVEGVTPYTAPVYNLVPPRGVAAEFGFIVARVAPVLLLSSVRSGTDYGVTTDVPDVSQAGGVLASKLTLWGVPGEASHDPWRGTCEFELAGKVQTSFEGVGRGLRESEIEREGPNYYVNESLDVGLPESKCSAKSEHAPVPLLTLPTSCGRPLTASIAVDSWEEPGDFSGSRRAQASLRPLTGCENLAFSTKLEVTPEKTTGSTPTGVDVQSSQPPGGIESPGGLSQADLKEYSVVLPEGLQLNASSVNGLETCSPAQIGYTGSTELDPSTEPGVLTPQFTPAAASCPDASKIGNVRIKSPLLEGELEGSIYVASPQNYKAGPLENPFGSLTAAYAVAEEEKTGVLVKLPANILRNPETGQLTFTLKQSPQLPYSVAKIELFPGERAPLATGPRCGSFTTEGTFTPWSATAPFLSSSSFQITSGAAGTACPSGALSFSPALQTGTASNNAGAFSPLTTVIHREDGQQAIHNVTINYPPGVSAVLTGVPQCPEAQANAGTCGAESLIGEDSASVGLGQDPYTVTGGKVYLTGPYDGAPFGLSIVTPTKAGPFVLDEGAPVVTRAKIDINPTTAAVTVTTGEIPRILDGIPLQVKTIDVNINRPNFAINPSSCEHMSVSGSVGGWDGASFPVSDPFQVSSCESLPFHPQFSASTQGHTSKANGASLHVKIASAGLGQASISKVDLTIPAILPTRLTTIQKACTEAQFNANPAGCPAASLIATATVHTPLLPDALSGPVYFVSHGGAAFPDTEIILQGDGVTLLLDGHTQIKKGITYSRFETVPDAPFQSFEFNAPEGPYSIFGSDAPQLDNYSLCQSEVRMPTTLVAQNGAVINQSTLVEPTGCANKITILSHRVKKRTLTLQVGLPAAGKLTVSANGLSKVSKTAKGRGTMTLTLKAKGDRKLKTKVKLTFTPSKGKKLAAAVTAKFKR
jgi:hypothetical protein